MFAAGNRVEFRHPGRDKYIAMMFYEGADRGSNATSRIKIYPVVYGLGERDDLKFRFELKIDGRRVGNSDWQQAPDIDFPAIDLHADNGVLKAFVRNDNAGGTVYSTGIIPLENVSPSLFSLGR